MKKLTKPKSGEILQTAIPYFIVFVISMVVGLLVYKAKEIEPFGNKSVLCMDLWGQYFPMYVQNKEANLKEMLYSWNGAFGYNNWAQNAYYCNSVFLLLFKLFPVQKLVWLLNFIALLKLSFSSVTCLAFLRHKTQTKSPITIAGAVSYSLCAYMLAFYSQCMWTDSLIYLPLILIGLERMLDGKKPLMYTIFLALTIISNFYIGFSICIFITLYFICLAVPMIGIGKNEAGKLSPYGFKKLGTSILRFGVFSLLGGAIAAIVILPVGKAIGNTIASDIAAPDHLVWYADLTAYLQELLPNRPLSLGYTGTNIATTILVFIMMPVYFFNNSIKLSERIANILIVVFLFASLNCNFLDYMWHGFHFPNQLPGRWTFMLSLMLVSLCCQGVAKIRSLPVIGAAMGIGIGTGVLIYTLNGHGSQEGVALETKYIVMLAIAGAMILAASIFGRMAKSAEKKITAAEAAEKAALEAAEQAETDESETESADAEITSETSDEQKETSDETVEAPKTEPAKPIDIKKTKKLMSAFSAVAVCCLTVVSAIQIYDSGTNFYNVANLEKEGLPVAEGVNYAKTCARNVNTGKLWKSGNDDFYRCIANSGFTFNPSMIGNYHGMGYYSSTMNGSVFELMRFLGNRVYAENVSTIYNSTSPVQNGLFGVKYIIDFDHSFGYFCPEITMKEEGETCNIWENPTALPVAYVASDNVTELQITDQVRGIKNQNDILNSVCGREVNAFSKLECASFAMQNLHLQENPNWNQNYFCADDYTQPCVFDYVYKFDEAGAYYLEHNFRAGKIIVTWNENTKEINVGSERIAYLGKFDAGTELKINVTIENVGVGCCGLNVYKYDENAWKSAYNQLMEQKFELEKFDTTYLKGRINKTSDGLLMTTIPQDGGWKAYCDGKKLETVKAFNTFMAFKIPEGEHKIEFKYSVPGFAPGLTLSIIGLLVLILLSYPNLWKKYFPVSEKKTDKTEEKE